MVIFVYWLHVRKCMISQARVKGNGGCQSPMDVAYVLLSLGYILLAWFSNGWYYWMYGCYKDRVAEKVLWRVGKGDFVASTIPLI